MTDIEPQDTEHVTALADLLGVALRPEHVAEVARAWRLMAHHRQCVAAVALDPADEPAALFRP